MGSILLRPHPAHKIDIDLTLPKLRLSIDGSTLLEDAERCDLVIGANSSFHLSVLKYGIPCAYFDPIDYIDYDYYQFIQEKILYEITDINTLPLEEINQFYKQKEWQQNFQKFDASYGNTTQTLYSQIQKIYYH